MTLPNKTEHRAIVDTHRHPIGPKLAAKMAERGLYDPKQEFPQTNAQDLICYREFFDLDYAMPKQREGGVIAIGFDMLVAAILVHVHFGFFMNWFGKQKGEGIEFDLLLWAIALALIIQGAGAYSLDRVIAAKFQTAKTND
jgi:hypothetical protein